MATPSLLSLFFGIILVAQQPTTVDSYVTVYYDDEEVKAPQLLPVDFSPLLLNECKNEADGTVGLSLVVDSSGRPKNVAPRDSFDDDLDHMAIAIATNNQFTPGARDGNAVAVARNLDISLSICTAKVVGHNGKSSDRVRLKALPVQHLFAADKHPPEKMILSSKPQFEAPAHALALRVGASVSAPVPIETPEPQLTKEQRKFSGICLVSVIIDKYGVPQHPRVIRGINQDCDQKALDAVSRYRFKPAMKDKQPVPVMMTIEVNFRRY